LQSPVYRSVKCECLIYEGEHHIVYMVKSRQGINHLRNHRGLTLLEILIAMLILSVGLLGIAGLTTGVMRGNAFSSKVTTATTAAEQKIEEMRRIGYSGSAMADTTITEDYQTMTDYPSCKRITSIKMMDPGDAIKMITVAVFWDSDRHCVSLKTVLAE
jgi:prepilin-type N-terminal cleavage/methylation domain-containing protein